MKNLMLLLSMGLVCTIFFSIPALAGNTEPTQPVMKIGVFDSRVVALAYFRSEAYQLSLKQLGTENKKEYEKARAENNAERMKELENQGSWTQIRMHQQVFSNAGTSNIMTKMLDALSGIAREAGVVLIVAKWEMPYIDPAVETIDVTLPIAKLFKPDAQTLKIIEQMKDQPPVPFDELPLDPMM